MHFSLLFSSKAYLKVYFKAFKNLIAVFPWLGTNVPYDKIIHVMIVV